MAQQGGRHGGCWLAVIVGDMTRWRAPGGGVAEHGGDLAQLHQEGALRDGQSLLRCDAREDAVCEADGGARRRHEGPA